MIADSMIAVVTLMLAITFMVGYQAVWLLFIISAVRALGAGIQTPAVGAILPQIVPQDQLTKVNGINGSLQALTMFVAPIVSAALLTVASIEAIFYRRRYGRDRDLYIVCLSQNPAAQKASDTQSTGYLDDFKEGLVYIKQHAFLKSFFIFFAFFFVLMAPAAFLLRCRLPAASGTMYGA